MIWRSEKTLLQTSGGWCSSVRSHRWWSWRRNWWTRLRSSSISSYRWTTQWTLSDSSCSTSGKAQTSFDPRWVCASSPLRVSQWRLHSSGWTDASHRGAFPVGKHAWSERNSGWSVKVEKITKNKCKKKKNYIKNIPPPPPQKRKNYKYFFFSNMFLNIFK